MWTKIQVVYAKKEVRIYNLNSKSQKKRVYPFLTKQNEYKKVKK